MIPLALRPITLPNRKDLGPTVLPFKAVNSVWTILSKYICMWISESMITTGRT